MSALEGASKYLNNLLLARGLLQNGKPIDFAHPDHGADNVDATMSKIINLVHDLVLRRDREAEQHEVMVATIRNIKAEESQRLLDFQRMQDKNISLQNKATTAEAQERAIKGDMRRLEAQVKELKDQALKMKSMMDQVKAKCVGDVKKRDTEIEKLRVHIAGLQRGKKEIRSTKTNTSIMQSGSMGSARRAGLNTSSKDWELERETTDLLTALVNETTTENVSLRRIVTDTIETLRDLTGLEQESEAEEDDGIGIPGQYRKSRQKAAEVAQTEALIPCEVLDEHLNVVLRHCKSILKDPSFVPIEEVQIREEEITKLKAGWEKMADRWKEAVTMMGQWKQHLNSDGQPDIESWSDLSFGRSVAFRPDGQPVLNQEDEVSAIFDRSEQRQEEQEQEMNLNHIAKPSLFSSADSELEPELELEPPRKRIVSSPARRGVRLPRPANPLSEVSGNSLRLFHSGTQSASHTSIGTSVEDYEDHENDTFQRQKARSKMHKQTHSLSISEKLAAVEAEALEAQEEQQKEVTNKRKTRSDSLHQRSRRSTLSPEELALLIGSHE